jgi:hypothetical protein
MEGAEMDATKTAVIPVRSGRIELPQSFDHQNLNLATDPEYLGEKIPKTIRKRFPDDPWPPVLLHQQRRALTRKRNVGFCAAPVLVEVGS